MLVSHNPSLAPRAAAAQRWGFMPNRSKIYVVTVDYPRSSDGELEEEHLTLVSADHLDEVMRIPVGNRRIKYLFRRHEDFRWFQYKVWTSL